MPILHLVLKAFIDRNGKQRVPSDLAVMKTFREEVDGIVISSMMPHKVSRIVRKRMLLHVDTTNRKLAKDWLKDLKSNYGEGAADSWMEGNIYLGDVGELELYLHSVAVDDALPVIVSTIAEINVDHTRMHRMMAAMRKLVA